jgi:hypothetical protein
MRLALLACIAVGTAHAPAFGIIHTVSRINNYSMSFSDDAFNNTLFHLEVRQDRTADAAGDSASNSFSLFPNTMNVTWEGFDGISVSNVMIQPATVTATITSPNGLPGYSVLRDIAPPDQNAIFIGSEFNRFFLRVTLQGAGGVDPGFPSVWRMMLPGDWSAVGHDQREHELLAYDPSWNLDSDFVFDPQAGTTLLALSTQSYSVPPAVQFALYGQTVPAPGAILVLGAGMLVGGRRSRGLAARVR